MKRKYGYSRGEVDGWMISTIGLIVLVLGAGSLAIWALLNYQDQKSNFDGKVTAAVAEAEKKQAEDLTNKFLLEQKDPRLTFNGPDDYGHISFTYPRTWSVYVDKDVTQGGDYMAYLNPVVVPPVSVGTQQFALRLSILNRNYNDYIKQYEGLVKEGTLKSSTVSINGNDVTRLDGNFTDQLRGAQIAFKLNDKTVVFQTDADTFKPDFDTLIKTITYK